MTQQDSIPLIPRKILFGNPDKVFVRLSPDGKKISYLAPLDGVMNVWAGPADDPTVAKPVTHDTGRGIRFYDWAYTNDHIAYIQDKDGDENWRIYSVNLDTGDSKCLTPAEGVHARIEKQSPKFPGEVIVALNDRNPEFHDLYLVNIRTGERRLVRENDEGFMEFLIDNDYNVRFASRIQKDGGIEMFKLTEKGEREFCGNILPEGLKKNQKFDEPIITPTTKSDEHDEKISAAEVVETGLMTQEQWDFLSDAALKLFDRGTKIAAENGLILVDTKYEFGHDEEGNIFLIDEIHTPDSSRYWIKDSYEERFAADEEPENIDKEFLRLWFREHCDPYNDPELPEAPEELVIELSSRYIQLYEMITGKEFSAKAGDPVERIAENLRKSGYL